MRNIIFRFSLSSPNWRALPLGLSLLLAVVLLGGCSDPTPEQKLEIAYQKVEEQRPPDLPGASNLLKEIIATDEVDPQIRLSAYQLLSNLYQSIGDLEKSQDFIRQAVEYFGLDTEQGQQAHQMLIGIMMRAGNTQQARANTAAKEELSEEAKAVVDDEMIQKTFEEVEMMLAREDLPGPRRVWYRLRKAELFDSLGESDQAAELFYQLAMEFEDAQIEQIALEQHVQIVLRQGPEAAAQSYIRFAEDKPDSPTAGMAKFGAGVFMQQAGMADEAAKLMEDFITENEAALEDEEMDDNERIMKSLSLARAYTLAQNIEGERSVYNRLIERYRDNHNLVVRLIQSNIESYMKVRDFDGAVEALAEYERDFAGTQIADTMSGLTARVIQIQKQLEAQAEAVAQAEAGPAETGTPDAEEPAPEAAEDTDSAVEAEEVEAEDGATSPSAG